MKRTHLFAFALCAALLLTPASAAQKPLSSPAAEADAPQAALNYQVSWNGRPVDLSQAPRAPYQQNGHVMLPLWLLAQAMGDTVVWLPAEEAVRVENGEATLILYFGVDKYFLSGKQEGADTQSQTLGAAPQEWAGRTYVPAELFRLLGREVAVDGVQVKLSDGTAQRPNPVVEYDAVFQAEYAVGFPVLVPTTRKDVAMEHIYVVDGKLVSIQYADGMIYRAAKGTGDVSGDYSTYPDEQTLTVGRFVLTVKGEGEQVKLALWNDGTYCYSAFYPEAVPLEGVRAMVGSLSQMN